MVSWPLAIRKWTLNMKAIHSLVTKIVGNKITITGEIMDVSFPGFIGQRNTIMHNVLGNPSKPRHMQINSHGALVTRHGTDGVLFPKDELISVMIEVDNKLTDAPLFQVHPSKDSLTSAKVISELPMTGVHQQSDDGKTWTDIKLEKDFKPKPGKHYRMVARNKCGETCSNHVCIPKKK